MSAVQAVLLAILIAAPGLVAAVLAVRERDREISRIAAQHKSDVETLLKIIDVFKTVTATSATPPSSAPTHVDLTQSKTTTSAKKRRARRAT